MNTKPLTSLRGFGKSALAGLLAVLVFVSILASASPALHHWLHADHQAPSHYCLVTLLDHGQTEPMAIGPVITVPENFVVMAVSIEFSFLSRDTMLFPERGPPCPA